MDDNANLPYDGPVGVRITGGFSKINASTNNTRHGREDAFTIAPYHGLPRKFTKLKSTDWWQRCCQHARCTTGWPSDLS